MRDTSIQPADLPLVPVSWNDLPAELQLILSCEALRRAAETLAVQAEVLAEEMDDGALTDQSGPDALRLFAAVVRAINDDGFATAGNA